jgi:hypothetical protein
LVTNGFFLWIFGFREREREREREEVREKMEEAIRN